MRKLEIDFRTEHGGGSSCRVYEGPCIKIAMGNWTEVDLEGLATFLGVRS